MKKKLLIILLVLGVLATLFFSSGTFWRSVFSPRHVERLMSTGFLALAEDIYRMGATMGQVPVEAIKKVVIDMKVADYVDELPLSDEVRTRLKDRLHDERYMARVVPFLLAVRSQYSEPENPVKIKFENVARSIPLLRLPGSEHELFSWKPAEKEADSPAISLSRDMAANLVSIYDSVFIQGKSTISDDENLERPFRPNSENDLELVDRTKPFVRDLLLGLKDKTQTEKAGTVDPGAANAEAAQMLDILLGDEKKLEAVTISLVDFVKYMVHKSYRYFALKMIREIELKNWLYNKLEGNKHDEILAFLEQSENRRYAVQIGVDGLQGGLLRSLVRPDRNEAFLKRVINDFEEARKFKPDGQTVTTPNYSHTIGFLRYLFQKKSTPDAYLPFFKSVFADYSQNISTGGISTSPTISVRNLPIVFTGADVAGPHGTGIPNFHFVDRGHKNHRAYYFYGNDALLLESLAEARGMITMFERLRGISTLNCNAQYEWHSHASFDGLLNLAIGEGDRDFGEIRCYNELQIRAENEIELRSIRQQLKVVMKEIKDSPLPDTTLRHRARQLFDSLAKLEQEVIPQYLLIYFPWPDHFAHFKGPFSDEIVSTTGELNRLDYWLGKITEAYKSAGVYPQTLFGMAGDHGLAPVFYALNPEKTVLEELARDLGREIRVKKISSDEGEGPKINHSIRPDSMKGYDVVIASTAGGNYMMDFFNGQENAVWRTQPVFDDLVKLKLLDNGPPIDIIGEMVARLGETLDYLAVRETRCTQKECRLRLVATRNGQQVADFIHRKGNRIFYLPDEGTLKKSLLDLAETNPYHPFSQEETTLHASLLQDCLRRQDPDDASTWCDEETWRKIASFTPRPDSVVQLSHLYDEDRAGTINLFPRYGIGYNTKVPGRHAGESFHEKDAFIGFWGEPTRSDNVNSLGPTVIGSLAPTIYDYLSGADLEKNSGGFGFPSVWEEIRKQNFSD